MAIKIIRPDVADSPEFIRGFEVEARTIARIEHPNVVPLFDFWREPGAAYLVMRYLRGGTVEQALRSGGPFSRRGGDLDGVGADAAGGAEDEDLVAGSDAAEAVSAGFARDDRSDR